MVRPRFQRAAAVLALALVAAPAGATVAPAGTHGGAQAQTQVTGCDYESLYDDTIDSVVSIRASGGLGSGFVYEPNLSANASAPALDEANATAQQNANATYVVTNAHVVGDAAAVEVQFSNEVVRQGEVVGRDRSTDLAVVRVADAPESAEPLPLAEGVPQHGEPVAALGNPFGFEETITHGIVSGTNRSLPGQTGYRIPNTIQTDAPISPGNSGGPLVSCDGRVVGVNTAGISAQGAENVGFAVSAQVVDRVAPRLVANGTFDHAFLGVGVADVTPAVAAANDFDTTDGVLVATVVEGSPADEVLRESDRVAVVDDRRIPVGGDVILSVAGTDVSTPEDLASVLLTEAQPGEEVTLTIRRDGQQRTVTTTVTERPAPEEA